MDRKSVLFVLGSVLVLWLMAIPVVGAQPSPGSKAPIITRTFAVESGIFGEPWRVYIEAEDPDGDMLRVAAVVIQVGYGYYPTSWTYLKRESGKSLRGYLQWNTSSSQYQPEWSRLTLTVSVFDRAGNESNEVVFPYTFETGIRRSSKPTPPFDQGDVARLGYVNVNLYDPSRMGSGGSRPF